jgi:feruloyl esterase
MGHLMSAATPGRRLSARENAVASRAAFLLIAVGVLLLTACTAFQQTRRAQAGVASASCEAVTDAFSYSGVHVLSARRVAADALKVPGVAQPMPEHCVVTGRMNERRSPVDGKEYAIGFEMRLPTQWNGRFFYQANGGLDGFVTPAYGNVLGGGPTTNGLLKGFAVLSSDAGHAFERSNPVTGAALFGLDPQARLDYGYNAVAQLTQMARALITHYYGRPADRAYLVGTSNGGRHGMVAAARDTGGYDGILVTAPGYNLPQAAVAQVWDAQQFASVARARKPDGVPDLESSFTPAELDLVAQKILDRCDALDGLRDGIVGDLSACQRRFDPLRDVPTCEDDTSSGTQCLSMRRKQVLATVFAGPGTYAGLPWDPGLRGRNWREWKFVNSIGPRDAIALAFVFTTPPVSPQTVSGSGTSVSDYALRFSLETDAPRIHARDDLYTQSAMEFMTPPEATVMRSFVQHGGKLIVAHGAADPVFSALDTIRWYDGFLHVHGAKGKDSARLFIVPGMNHSSGGPAADQFDMVDALVDWVERGIAPESVIAAARGAGAATPNPEVPADWSPRRTRLLCPWPSVARYRSGDPESAASFVCAAP